VSSSSADLRIRSLRPPKAQLDPLTPHGSIVEQERRPDGTVENALTVFLTGAECPFTCAFCDLWKYTLDGPTPPGALVTQLTSAIRGKSADRLKLYNASNFFDSRAVPAEDVTGIAKLAESFQSLTVESHASMVGGRAVEFARRIPGRLEVAIGLETIHPTALEQLNKRLDVARFDRAAQFLRNNGIDLRVFVLLGTPFIPRGESIEWTVRAVEHAAERGAAVVSIIPLRGGNGEMERLKGLGQFFPPTLAEIERTLADCARITGTAVTVDLWDIGRFSQCEHCLTQRADRLRRSNLTGSVEPSIECRWCGTGNAIM
jgi:radical SAM enzyme (TIGR01210 family)